MLRRKFIQAVFGVLASCYAPGVLKPLLRDDEYEIPVWLRGQAYAISTPARVTPWTEYMAAIVAKPSRANTLNVEFREDGRMGSMS